jgi:hypothetical protein
MRNQRWKDGEALSIFIPMMHAKGASMNTALSFGSQRLAARQIVDIADASHLRIECVSGCVWITLDHDPRDIILEPGEAIGDLGASRALVYALQDSQLSVVEQDAPLAIAPGVRARPMLAAH